MYLTNQQLIAQRTENWGNLGTFSEYLHVALSLVKKYGSSSVKGWLLASIKTADTWVAEVVELLAAVGKLDQKNLSRLVIELQWLGWWQSESYVVKSINAEKVEWEIDPTADKVVSSKIEVQISGDGKIYKRGLDRDLGKMLK